MIPKQTLINFPEFSNNGTRTKPDDAKYAQGFLPTDVLPAEWTNYFFHGATKGISDLNAGITSIEEELINILTAAGIEPATATKNQLVSAIQTLITNKTGTLTNLTTAAKNNLVAALNEVKGGLGTAAAKNVDTEIGATAGENLPTSAAVTQQLNTKLTKYDLKEGFCVCSSDASAEVKKLTIPEFAGVNLASGSKITVVMTNGNTYGTCVGTTSNKITEDQAVKFSINGGASYPVKVGGEYVGEGFMNAGDCHLFVYDGTAWNDLTADVIYQGSTSNGNYTKKRNGLIEQWGNCKPFGTNSTYVVSFPVFFSNTNYFGKGQFLGIGVKGASGSSVKVEKTSISEMKIHNNSYYDDKLTGMDWGANGY